MLPFLAFLLVLLVCLSSLANLAYAASPDLTVENVWLEKASNPGEVVSSVASGEQFIIVASVKNIGDAPGSGYYLDVYHDSDFGRGGPDSIAAGEVQVWYVGPLTAQDGSHTTRWIVDPDNQIAEANENDNEKDLTFTIGGSETQSPTLMLAPTSGRVGTVVSVTGSNYQGTTCQLISSPLGLFSSQLCSIAADALAGTFTVDSGATAQIYTVTVQTDASDSAANTFTVLQTYSVTFYSDPISGIVTVDGAAQTNNQTQSGYSIGQRVHVVASPLSGYLFTSWETSGVSVDSSTSQDTYVTVTGDGWLKAHFTLITCTVTFYSEPSSGTITAGGVAESDSATEAYASGSRVNVVANPPSGYVFSSWEANGVSVDSQSQDTYMTVSSNGWVRAHFAQPQVTVKSKSILGAEFSGARVKVDQSYYTTPFSLTLQGMHSFAAPSSVTIKKVTYTFARWEDESGNALSTTTSLSYSIQSSKTLYAVYSPPQYSVTIYAYDATSRKAVIAGASVYLDGNLVGTTDSRGSVVLKGIYPGAHALEIHKDGYVDYVTTITLSKSATFQAYLNRAS